MLRLAPENEDEGASDAAYVERFIVLVQNKDTVVQYHSRSSLSRVNPSVQTGTKI